MFLPWILTSIMGFFGDLLAWFRTSSIVFVISSRLVLTESCSLRSSSIHSGLASSPEISTWKNPFLVFFIPSLVVNSIDPGYAIGPFRY